MLLTYNVYYYILHWKTVVEEVFTFALILFLRSFLFLFRMAYIYQLHIDSNKKYIYILKK